MATQGFDFEFKSRFGRQAQGLQFGWQPKVLTLNLNRNLKAGLGGSPRSSVWVATQGFDFEFKSRFGRQAHNLEAARKPPPFITP
ncbi:hypothetical protein EAH77_07505 [Ewingella americana]|uniref:Uncharacterized protein n=1 Tax=Ewingella americana TaxID=41202 RepID=A0A502GPG0_9GAMM|nr:hypothetical protein EAH77_07505 [Ewingella americana]